VGCWRRRCGADKKARCKSRGQGRLGVELSEEGSLEGERTRLGLASITPACPWSFHTAQNKRDLRLLTGEQRPSPPEGPLSPSELLPALIPAARLSAASSLCPRRCPRRMPTVGTSLCWPAPQDTPWMTATRTRLCREGWASHLYYTPEAH
jgi:hypothetical protein